MWASAPTGRNHRTSRKSGAGPGGHTGRPYGKTGGGSVGADFISAHTHRRVGCTHPVGADVGISPYEAEPSNLAKIGSRSGRPYRPPLRGNRRRVRRGGLYGRPCAPTCWMHHRRTHPARYRQQKHHRRTYPPWGASGDGAIYTGTVVDSPPRTGSKQAGQPLFADGDV